MIIRAAAFALIAVLIGLPEARGSENVPADQWPFEDPENVATFTVRKIVEDGSPILLVTHDEDDGAWQFLTADKVSTSDMMIVGLGQMVEVDPTLTQLADLPLGWKAVRDGPDKPWKREPIVDERSGEVSK